MRDHGKPSRRESFRRVSGTNWVLGRYLLPEMQRLCAGHAGDILDLACGESPFRDLFVHATSYRRMDLMPQDEEVITADMTNLPLPDAAVDTVLLSQAISDSPDPSAVLRECARVLRPSGSVLIVETVSHPEHDAPYDYFRILPSGLHHLSEQAGLQVEQITRLGGLFARYATLNTNALLEPLNRRGVTRPVFKVLAGASNLALYGLDRLLYVRSCYPDYVAVLRRQAPAHT